MTNKELKLEAALIRIRTLARPGQALYLRDAIDLICDIWKEADSAIGEQAKHETTNQEAPAADHS